MIDKYVEFLSGLLEPQNLFQSYQVGRSNYYLLLVV